MENVEIIKNNCAEYIQNGNALDVLRKANGKNGYKEIAKILSLHPTIVSGLLKKAEKFGLAKKVKIGIYKKIPGILGYMHIGAKPKKEPTRDMPSLIKKIYKNVSINIPNNVYISNRISTNMSKMSRAYEFLYLTENSLRELIRGVLNQKIDWWVKHIPSGIQKTVEEEVERTAYHAAKRNDNLEHTHLGQLKEIIVYNWNDFSHLIKEKNKNSFTATIDKAIPSRNALGHCIPLNSGDLKIVDVRFKDILEMLK